MCWVSPCIVIDKKNMIQASSIWCPIKKRYSLWVLPKERLLAVTLRGEKEKFYSLAPLECFIFYGTVPPYPRDHPSECLPVGVLLVRQQYNDSLINAPDRRVTPVGGRGGEGRGGERRGEREAGREGGKREGVDQTASPGCHRADCCCCCAAAQTTRLFNLPFSKPFHTGFGCERTTRSLCLDREKFLGGERA